MAEQHTKRSFDNQWDNIIKSLGQQMVLQFFKTLGKQMWLHINEILYIFYWDIINCKLTKLCSSFAEILFIRYEIWK